MSERATGGDGITMATLSVFINLLVSLRRKGVLSREELRELVDGPLLLIEQLPPAQRTPVARATYRALQEMLAAVSDTRG